MFNWLKNLFKSGGVISIYFTKKDWSKWYTEGEMQRKEGLETMACTSFSFAKTYQVLLNYLMSQGFFDSLDVDWFQQNGYLNANGRFNFSDRALAQEAGTTKSGNYTKAVEAAAQKMGLVPESLWPWPDKVTWDDYYKPLPQYVYDMGKEWNARYDVFIEKIYKRNFVKNLPKSPILTYVYGWTRDGKGIYYRPDGYGFNHAISVYAPNSGSVWPIADSYSPFFKEVYDSNLYPWGYVLHIINHHYMNAEKYTQENDLKFVRNRETGQFGRIIGGVLRVIEDDPSRAALMLMDDKVRDDGLNVSNKTWEALPKKPF